MRDSIRRVDGDNQRSSDEEASLRARIVNARRTRELAANEEVLHRNINSLLLQQDTDAGRRSPNRSEARNPRTGEGDRGNSASEGREPQRARPSQSGDSRQTSRDVEGRQPQSDGRGDLPGPDRGRQDSYEGRGGNRPPVETRRNVDRPIDNNALHAQLMEYQLRHCTSQFRQLDYSLN